MAKDKAPVKTSNKSNAAKVSVEMIRASERILIAWVKAGESNFLSGYSSNIAITDFLFNAGMISQRAYDATFLQTNIFAGITDFNALFGTLFGAGSPLTPQMKSRVEQNTDRGKGDDEDEDQFGAAISQLATQALAAATEVAMVA